jgi:hypothetical protein
MPFGIEPSGSPSCRPDTPRGASRAGAVKAGRCVGRRRHRRFRPRLDVGSSSDEDDLDTVRFSFARSHWFCFLRQIAQKRKRQAMPGASLTYVPGQVSSRLTTCSLHRAGKHSFHWCPSTGPRYSRERRKGFQRPPNCCRCCQSHRIGIHHARSS